MAAPLVLDSNQPWAQFAKLVLVTLGYFAGAKLGLYFPTHDSHITLFWLPTGLATAILLRWGSPYIIGGIFLGAFLFDLSLDTAIPPALLSAAGNTLAPLSAVWLLKRWRFDPFLTRQNDLLALIAAASLSTLLPAAIGILSLWWGDQLPPSGMPVAWLNWWLGDMMSILLFGPLLLSLNRSSLTELRQRPAQMWLCAALLGFSGWLVFLADFGHHLLPLAFLPLPLVLWAALRLGATGAALAVVSLSMITAIGTALNLGVFGTLPADESMYMAWLYMFIVALIGLMATTMLGERKKFEASLLRVNELLREAQSVAKIGSWRLNLSNDELVWSDETYRIFGVPAGTPLHYGCFLKNVHPDDKERVDAAWRAALQGAPYHIQHRILVNGETRWVEERARLDIDAAGNLLSGTGSVQDITERQRIEAELQESEARYRNFAEQLPLGVVVTQEGQIKYVNQTSIDLIGYSKNELMDKPFMPLVYAADRAWLLDLHQRRMQGEQVATPYVVRMTRKDGQIRQWEMHASTINWKGKVSGFGIIADITERIKLEQQLLDSLHQLEQKELSKTRFLAAAGHDLRQPIAAANLYVGALRLSATTERQLDLIERLDKSMNVFSDLLERLLDISKFDAGLIQPKFSTFNLVELFNWLEQNFTLPAHEKDLSLRLFIPLDRALIVRTDIGLLQSVVMNLVTNALKFTSRGGILVSARERGNHVLLQVWDTGCGIADADLPYIFDEFYQANNPQRSREAGLGLGLSICQRAMSLLDGKVTCRSRPGHGSVFELEIPLNVERRKTGHLSPRNHTAEVLPSETLVRGKRVVVLEDDALVAEGLLFLLEELGAHALHFPSAEEALRHTDIINTDFFIVDFALDGKLTGIDFLQTLQQGKTARLIAVVITGETSSHFIGSTRDTPWPVLHKPANLGKLLNSLQQQTVRN